MTETSPALSALLRYPGVARARIVYTDNGMVAQVLPWGRPCGRLGTGAVAELAELNPSETTFLHDEIFVAESYLQGGVVLRQDAVVFDVGANIGMFALFVAARCPSARMLAFEPVPEIFDRLRVNIERRAIPAQLFQYGLSDRNEEISFNYYPGLSIMSCRSEYAEFDNERTLLELYLEHARESAPPERDEHFAYVDSLLAKDFEWSQRRCQLRRTSDVIDQTGVQRVDLLKIDAQRAELDVLRGVDERHWPMIHQISMEVHDEAGCPTEGRLPVVTNLLRDRGFQVRATEPAMLAGTGRFAVQAVRPDYADDPRPMLAAAGKGDHLLRGEQLRAWLATMLPAHLIPDRVDVVPELPDRA